MRISTARMHSDRPDTPVNGEATGRAVPGSLRGDRPRVPAFVLVELLIVVSLLGLLVMIVQTNLFGVLRRQSFRSQVQDFVSTMQMAAVGAAQSGRRYEVVIDPMEQQYLLRVITSSNLADVLEEEIITQGVFASNCRLVYVEFDDGDYTNDRRARFRIGRGGWTYGGKIVFIDENEQVYAVIVNRLTPIIELVEGDPQLMPPRTKEQVPFL
jgi:Tfp pilus assembly protein FimT